MHYSYTRVCIITPSRNLPDSNAMLLPGRVPGYKDTDVKLLPSSTTKHTIWEQYIQAAATTLMRAVAYSTFTHLWRQLLPNVIAMKPMSDLCWVCQQNSTVIMRSANRPDEKKTVSTEDSACILMHKCITRWALIKVYKCMILCHADPQTS